MSSGELTYLLTILLIASVVILGILIIVFIALSINKNKKEKKFDEAMIQTGEI